MELPLRMHIFSGIIARMKENRGSKATVGLKSYSNSMAEIAMEQELKIFL